MDKRVLGWLITHKGKTFSSPRKVVFGREVKDLEIVDVDERNERVRIRFEGRKYLALPLTFLMFERAKKYIVENKGKYVRLGTSINNPQPSTIEGEIWKKPYPISYKTPYKTASHICDIHVLADIAEYGYVKNPLTGRRVQGIK